MSAPTITDLAFIEAASALSSAKPGTGFVSVRVADQGPEHSMVGQVDVATARQIAMQFLAAAEAAEADAALFVFLTESTGTDEGTALSTIAALRQFRADP